MRRVARRLPVGAELQGDGSGHFRAWAPRAREMRVVVNDRAGGERTIPMAPEEHGYFAATVPEVAAGDRYQYELDGHRYPDPASRFQPDGPFGWSEVVDPSSYHWKDAAWVGVKLAGQVLYELHVGTFTHEGTWRGAMKRLAHLHRVGVTVVEIMPVAEFPGDFGWGYDGVFPFAPTRLYGNPDDFRAFVDEAHQIGVGVILDVVYNHLGPSGAVHREYAKEYFTAEYDNEWGDALNFDGPGSAAVREYFISNAAYWIDEFHLDGLRLDAIQSIHDRSPEHVVTALTRRAREAAGTRSIIVVAENEKQQTEFLSPDRGAGMLDAVWNDDFHHTAVVAITGQREAYYSDHHGRPQELISAAKYGYLFQGQRYAWQKQPRGTRTDGVPPSAFITFLENHDQVANSSVTGHRLCHRADSGRTRAATALLLLLPSTPMLFQGQEFGSSAPFLYFAHHTGGLAKAVQEGRASHVRQFPSIASDEAQASLPVPHDRSTFDRCKLQWDELTSNEAWYKLHHDLIRLRRTDAAFRRQPRDIDGAVLDSEALVLRFPAAHALDERILVVNFGPDVVASSFAEPLVAPPAGCTWQTRWSSERLAYGGSGSYPIVTADGWRLPAHSATVLAPIDVHDGDPAQR